MDAAELRHLIDQQPPAVAAINRRRLEQISITSKASQLVAAPPAPAKQKDGPRFVDCGHQACEHKGCVERRTLTIVFAGRADSVNKRIGGGMRAEMGAKLRGRNQAKRIVTDWMDLHGHPTFRAASFVWRPFISSGYRRDTDSIVLWAKNALDGAVLAGLVPGDGPEQNLGFAVLPCVRERGPDAFDRVELTVLTNQNLAL